MTNPADTLSENLKRIPGLFRRWELPGVFEANRDYHIEDAGLHADGTPLVALYSGEVSEYSDAPAGKGTRGGADPRDAIPTNLLSEDIVAALPLTLDIRALSDNRPLPLPLFSAGGATVGDLREAITKLGQMFDAERRKLHALSRLHQELVAHGADQYSGIHETLAIIATADDNADFGGRPARQSASPAPISHPPTKACRDGSQLA